MKVIRTVGALLLVAGSLAACSSTPQSAVTASGQATASPALSDVVGQVDAPASLKKGWEGVRADVAMGECPVEAGSVTVSGTVKNSAKKTRDIAILISWNLPDTTHTILQLATMSENVPAGGSAEWSVSGELPADAGSCVLNARSGTLQD